MIHRSTVDVSVSTLNCSEVVGMEEEGGFVSRDRNFRCDSKYGNALRVIGGVTLVLVSIFIPLLLYKILKAHWKRGKLGD
jgi:hypothetical protein